MEKVFLVGVGIGLLSFIVGMIVAHTGIDATVVGIMTFGGLFAALIFSLTAFLFGSSNSMP